MTMMITIIIVIVNDSNNNNNILLLNNIYLYLVTRHCVHIPALSFDLSSWRPTGVQKTRRLPRLSAESAARRSHWRHGAEQQRRRLPQRFQVTHHLWTDQPRQVEPVTAATCHDLVVMTPLKIDPPQASTGWIGVPPVVWCSIWCCETPHSKIIFENMLYLTWKHLIASAFSSTTNYWIFNVITTS